MSQGKPGTAPRGLWLPVAIALCTLLAALGGDLAREALRYERSAILHGELWRLVTAHVVHLSWAHSALNLVGLALVWTLFARALRGPRGLIVLGVSAAAIDAGFLLRDTQLEWYVGLSGVLHGLFAAGALAGAFARAPQPWLLPALLLIKLAWEQWAGPVPLTESLTGGPVIANAHLYGAFGGALAALGARLSGQRL